VPQVRVLLLDANLGEDQPKYPVLTVSKNLQRRSIPRVAVRLYDDLSHPDRGPRGSAEGAQRKTAGTRRAASSIHRSGELRTNCSTSRSRCLINSMFWRSGIVVTFVLRTAFSSRASFFPKSKLRRPEPDSGVATPSLRRLRQCSLKTCLRPNRSCSCDNSFVGNILRTSIME
jgi:hypothetical protein